MPVDQIHLEKVLRCIFPSENIITNARKQALLKNSESGQFLELDFFLPQLHLCFEFQDAHHYVTAWYSHLPLSGVRTTDDNKQAMVLRKSDTLIIVPCWWDGGQDSLIATLLFQRSELPLSTNACPIPLNPPLAFFEVKSIADVGELMQASFPPSFLLSDINPWWAGEKYDGVRACWNPINKKLYSRAGFDIALLNIDLKVHLPKIFLEGEIWCGRGEFAEAQSIFHASPSTADSPIFRLIGFDCPQDRVGLVESRYKTLLSVTNSRHPFLIIAARMLCTRKHQLARMVQDTIAKSGEGVILQKCKSYYEPGRSPWLYKFKASRGDEEALVVDVAEDNLNLQLPDGVIFSVPSSNCDVTPKPKRGDIVSFSYDAYTRHSAPINPKIFRIRSDVSWKDLVVESARDNAVNAPSGKSLGMQAKFRGYWMSEKGKNLRAFLEAYAKSRNFDPLIAENWYNVRYATVIKTMKMTRASMSQYDRKFHQTLIGVFPDIGLQEDKFEDLPKKYWKNASNRRKFFDAFARSQSVDPLVPSNWYSLNSKLFFSTKSATSVLFYHKGSFVKALVNLYPNIGLDATKFNKLPNVYMKDVSNRRMFLDELAKERGADPLKPDTWYSMSYADVYYKKGGRGLLSKYGGNLASALLHIYSDLNLDPTKFAKIQRLPPLPRKRSKYK